MLLYLYLLEKVNHPANSWIITQVDDTANADRYGEAYDGHNQNNYIIRVEIHVFLSKQYIPMSKNEGIS